MSHRMAASETARRSQFRRRQRRVSAFALASFATFFLIAIPEVGARPRQPPRAPSGYLDPARAATDVPEVLRENDAFCKQPSRPLSLRARSLCGLADRIPNCEGFRSACAEDRVPAVPEKEPEPQGSFVETLKKALAHVAYALIWILIAAVVLAVLFPVLRALVRTRRDKTFAETVNGPKTAAGDTASPKNELLSEDDAELLLRRAEEHAQQGNLEAALFTYLNASLRALDQRGAIRIARHRTNGEYVRACNEPEAKEPLYAIVREVDRVQFGGVQPTLDAVSHAGTRAVSLVRAMHIAKVAPHVLSSTLLLVAVVSFASLATGCGFHFPNRGGHASDPAGHEILRELLHRQGINVGKLGKSLASMPLPDQKGQTLPFAILIDTDRTVLEAAAEERLMQWVQAGGFLILAGSPRLWPNELGATADSSDSLDIDADMAFDQSGVHRGRVVQPAGVRFKEPEASYPLAMTGDGKIYAATRAMRSGRVIAIASSDLLMNAQLTQSGNAWTIVSILQGLDRSELRIAEPEDGIAPASNPITALERAGLGLGLYHALAATFVLFLAVGIRLSRSRPNPPAARRAFTEHIEATGAFYHRRRAATHALAAYARYAGERVRQRLPRGTQDVGAWLAQRSGASAEECASIWKRATDVHTFAIPQGDELVVLKRLSAIVSAALRMDK